MASTTTERRFGVNVGKAIKVPCKAATTANITLSGEQTIDGVACVTDDRVLVRNQTDTTENGVYYVDTGSWTRTPDFDDINDATEGTWVYVIDGSVYGETVFKVSTSGSITPGTTSLSFSIVFSSAFGTYAGIVVGNKTEAIAYIDAYGVTDGQQFHITSDDGGPFVAKSGAAGGTYSDDGGSYCGTTILPTAGDGSAALVRDYDGYISVIWFGATGDGTTDDYAAVQACIDYASVISGTVYFPHGDYLINGTLAVPDIGTGFYAVTLQGEGGMFIGTTALVHHSSQVKNPLINIQSSRSVKIMDLRLEGNNSAPQTQYGEGWINPNGADWVTAGIQDTQYGPYAGITVDALSASSGSYDFDTYSKGHSSKIYIARCRIQGFVAGIAIKPCNDNNGAEDIIIYDCHLLENKYGAVSTGSQQRNISLVNTNLYGSYCAVDNVTYGTQSGQPFNVLTCNIGKVYRFCQTSTDVGQAAVRDCYFENVASIGLLGKATSSANHSMLFTGCNFSLVGLAQNATDVSVGHQMDETLKSFIPAKFESCAFSMQTVMPLGLSKTVEFDNCVFRCLGSTAEQVAFGLYTTQGNDHRLSVRNSEQRSYSGTTKYLSDVIRLTSFPSKAIVSTNTYRIVDSNASQQRVYNMLRTDLTKTATINTVVYSKSNASLSTNDTVTFTETTAAFLFLKTNDLLYWRCHDPVLEGASGTTSMLPGLIVTSAVAGAITCKVIANVDNTYSPSSVDAILKNFISSVKMTGDTTSGNATITNMNSTANLDVNDWVVFNHTDLAQPVRVESKTANSITVSRTMNKTLSGVEVYNAKADLVEGLNIPGTITSFTDGDATPNVNGSRTFKTANTGATTITALDGGFIGQEVSIVIGDSNTTVDFTGTTLIGNAGVDWTPAQNSLMRCTYDGTNWHCLTADA